MAQVILRSDPNLSQLPIPESDRAWWAEQSTDFDAPAFPGEPTLPLDEFILLQVAFYRDMDTDAADLIADTLASLAAEVGFMRAGGPPIGVAEFRARKMEWQGWDLEGTEGGGR